MQGYFLSDELYERFQDLVLKRTGMLFGPKRRNALGRGVTGQCHKLADDDLNRYFQMLQREETDSPLWDALIEELTVGETYFFRDSNQIEALRRHILPQVIAAHRHDRRIRIWSAGCASGEEPYTLAMLLAELVGDVDSWNIFILGTDINKKVLKKARAARYREWSFRQTDPLVRKRYFRADGEEFVMLPSIRKNVQFAYLNLSEPVFPLLATNTNAMDLILCRNVAIYYSEDVVRNVVERFHRCLMWGGWLMMAAAETGIPVFDRFRPRVFSGGSVYQKTNEPAKPVEPPRSAGGGELKDLFSMPVPKGPYVVPKPPAEAFPPSKPIPGEFADEPLAADGELAETDLYSKGLDLLYQKRYEEAMETFLSCIAENPKDAASLYQMGRVQANIGQMAPARSFCEQAIEIDPLKAEAYYTLALICQESGDYKGALEKLKRCLFLDPAFELAHFTMAILCRKLNQKERADRHCRQVIKLVSNGDPDRVLAGGDNLTARTLLTMTKTLN